MSKHGSPSDVELQVLAVLWDRGPSSVREVRETLPDGKKRAYTTVLSLLQGLERKNLAGHESQGKTHIYHANVSREQVLEPLMKRMLRQVFGGRASQAVQYLLADDQVSDIELKQMRQVIDRYRKQKESRG
jgi:BlaI family transcriptional regulator, penicillinase repressor